jgi:predicted enzyme related to lactoylglutathione lyase
VTELGGKLLAPPMVIEGMGEIAVAADSLGGVFALYAGNFDD